MPDMDLLLALRSHATLWPDRLAISFEEQRLTYRELGKRVSMLVAAFRRRGALTGSRVGIASYQGVLPIELYLAAQAAGLQPVMLSWTLGPALTHAAKVLEVADLFAGKEALALPDIEGPWRLWPVDSDGLRAGGFIAPDEEPDERWVARRDPETISGIQFSAGSTGQPKAVLRTVRADVWDSWQKTLAYRATEGDCWLCITPMNLGVLVGAFRPMLLLGGSLAIIRHFDAGETIGSVRERGVTILPLQAPHWFSLLKHPEANRPFMSSLRTVVATGQRTPVGLAARIAECLPKARFVVNYGTTESSTIAVLSANDPAFGRPACVGKPLPTIEVEVVDSCGRLVKDHERGEIRLRGPSVVSGYDSSLGDAGESIRDGWFHTGDVGEWDERRNLYVVDRWSDVFEVGGARIFPGEVQERLFRVPGVQDAAVAGVESSTGSPHPTAFVVPTATPPDPADLKSAIAEVSPAHFSVRMVDRLPKTLGGKLDRAALKRGDVPAGDAPR